MPHTLYVYIRNLCSDHFPKRVHLVLDKKTFKYKIKKQNSDSIITKFALALTASSLLSLGGCTTLPKPLTSSVPAALSPEITLSRWWTRYNDPQLNAILEAACHESPSINEAAARVLKARAYEDQQEATHWPKARLQTYSFALGGDAPIDSLNIAGINFGWEVDFWGKNRAAIKAATSTGDAAANDVHQSILILSSALVSSYFELGRLYELHDTQTRTLIIREDTARLVAQKVSTGLSSQAELKLAEAAIYNARGTLLGLDERISLQRNLWCDYNTS
jgi:outer membrane protein TolC